MSTFTLDAQKPLIRATSRNPGLIGGSTTLEFTYPPSRELVEEMENASFATTIGGSQRKQADSWVRKVSLEWLEPSNYIPEKIYEMMRGGGNRALSSITYIHLRPMPSQLPGVENEYAPGLGKLMGYIADFKAPRVGRDASGTQMFKCRLVFQEADEVTP